MTPTIISRNTYVVIAVEKIKVEHEKSWTIFFNILFSFHIPTRSTNTQDPIKPLKKSMPDSNSAPVVC